MTLRVRERYRRWIPGGGQDADGSPSQGKVEAYGDIYVFGVTATNTLPPIYLGFSTLDSLVLRAKNDMYNATGDETVANYWDDQQKLYLYDKSAATGIKAATGANESFYIQYHAFGTSAANVELTPTASSTGSSYLIPGVES